MNIVLVGPPGAGKGTQAKYISEKFAIPHISTGDIFRKNISEKTSLGVKAKEYIEKGQLVPDVLTVSIVEDRIKQDDCKNGFMLDGFPRTVSQADALDEVLNSMEKKLDFVINIEVSSEILVERITGRRVCPKCGASFHVVFNPPKRDGICDFCGSNLMHRADDNAETVRKRLNIYEKQTQPLIEYYGVKKILRNIDGKQDIDRVFKDICQMLGSEC
ncbi:MAG TPA: adenylate kinase [Clostridiaceae bacterium]|jgi:adenylate kinase|nr:adenylate kinase [Clostridiaceae bacterium]HBG37995.1 adenylate kinase [Clostridiaceae bacterium]